MSLASSIGLNPKNPLVIVSAETLASGAVAFTPVAQTFVPTASGTAPYQLTTAGLTSLNVAEWNALTLANFQLTGVNNGVAVVYELVSFTGGSASTPNTLNFEMTPLVTLAANQTNQVYISINAPTLI
jgi:hypothetical protein